jgi:hypothetical protein
MNYVHFCWQKLCLMFFVLALSIGCGVKAPPIVPRSPVPQTIKDLEGFSRGGTIVLQWSIPKKNTEDKKLGNLAGFHIWRRFIPTEEKGCRTCKPDFELVLELAYEVPLGGETEEKMSYWDSQVAKEGAYFYYVSSYTTVWVESTGSNVVDLTWSPPLPPPVSIKANSGDRVVNLNWEVPPSLASEKGFGGVNIYRRSDNESYEVTPLNPSPILQNHFQDVTVANGEKYSYVLRSLKTLEEGTTEGKDSPEVSVIPEDLTPPATPLATMAFQSAEGIVIIWEPNIDSDLEGYYVYRRRENEAKPTRVSPLIKQETMYLDKTFVPGLTYYYSVTAIDQSPRHNESDFSPELKVATKKP